MLFFDDPSAEEGRDFEAWLAQLRAHLKTWKRTGTADGNRVACALPTRRMVTRVCGIARDLGLWWCDYTSDTNDLVKNAELADPAAYWVDIGLVAFTQTLSVGVDPQRIAFAACFLYVARIGCSVRSSCQGSLRFGRDPDFPLQCTTVFVCMQGRPLSGAALAAHAARMEGTSYHQRGLSIQQDRRLERQLGERAAPSPPLLHHRRSCTIASPHHVDPPLHRPGDCLRGPVRIRHGRARSRDDHGGSGWRVWRVQPTEASKY